MEQAAYPKDDKGRFLSGNIGGGRPKGARAKLGEAFIEALKDDFEENGIAAIQAVRSEKPDQYLKVIASLLPKDINLNFNDNSEMTDDELTSRIRDLAAQLSPFLLNGTGDVATGTENAAGSEQSAIVH
jgi:hypothetical protein